MTGLVTFDTPSHAGVSLVPPTPQNFSPPLLVFDVVASETLTSLSYLNGFNASPVEVLASGGVPTQANGALVSFASNTGQVVSVLPYTGGRAARSASRGPGQSRSGCIEGCL